jgi:tRNA U34 5-methylaminomethyl-2-thiouridine-forming methyltransferase MnmC
VNLDIIITGDGSNSLRNISLNETYHSIHGAIQESVYVFIQQGLMPLMSKDKSEISILEVGFGTGLNALLTLQKAQTDKQKVSYTALEPYPLPETIWKGLNYPDALDLADEFRCIHRSQWQIATELGDHFTLFKDKTSLQDATLQAGDFDLVYYDAFAPSKQPDLWELSVLEKVVSALRPEGIFVTYCAKGQLKRDLLSLRLNVETLPGPPGKKEMIRAHKMLK